MSRTEIQLERVLSEDAEHAPAPNGLLEKVLAGGRRRARRRRTAAVASAVSAVAVVATLVAAPLGPIGPYPGVQAWLAERLGTDRVDHRRSGDVDLALCVAYQGDRLSTASLNGANEDGDEITETVRDEAGGVRSRGRTLYNGDRGAAPRIDVLQGDLASQPLKNARDISVEGRAGRIGRGGLYLETGVRDSLLHLTGDDQKQLLTWARGIEPRRAAGECGR